MADITPEQARAYLERFALLEEMQAAELRRASVQSRFKQLSALMSSRHAFGAEADRERDLALVRERWARLRQALGG
jgi:hypothetical protein